MARIADGGVIPFDPARRLLVDSQDICTYIIPWATIRRLGLTVEREES